MKNKIFLSYRRDDVPGYVGRLEDELERAFGEDRIFRDVEDIAGGSSWKQAIDQSLEESAALILIIGPHWETIWRKRQSDPVNYVALELERARELGIAIIPVSLGGTKLSRDLDLGSISWLREKQTYDISDTQGRWDSDLKGLIKLLENIESVGPSISSDEVEPANLVIKKKRSGLGWAVAAAAVLIFGVWQAFTGPDGSDFDPDPVQQDQKTESGTEPSPSPSTQKTRDIQQSKQQPVIEPRPAVKHSDKRADTSSATQYPDISGTWVSKMDGTTYIVEQFDNGKFNIFSPGYAKGSGQFLDKMPRKFEFTLNAVGHGQFSVSNSSQTMIGWIIEDGSSRQTFDTLSKVN